MRKPDASKGAGGTLENAARKTRSYDVRIKLSLEIAAPHWNQGGIPKTREYDFVFESEHDVEFDDAYLFELFSDDVRNFFFHEFGLLLGDEVLFFPSVTVEPRDTP